MLYQLLSDFARKAPNSSAVVDSREQTFTYQEALARTHRWIKYFLEQGITSGDRVGVMLENEDDHVFILAALERLGATYVPFDSSIPPGSFQRDLEEVEVKKCLIENSLLDKYACSESIRLPFSAETILPDVEGVEELLKHIPYDPGDPNTVVYIVSSSGSTGDKKWIPITRHGLKYWVNVFRNQLGMTAENQMLATRSPAYDARIAEYLCAFSGGGCLHLLNSFERKDLNSILARCQKNSITSLLFIASLLGTQSSEKLIRLKEGGLKDLLVTGDACTPYLKSLCESQGIRLWNCYGPTEATFGISKLLLNGLSLPDSIVPIGLPYGEEIRVHIIEGEICIESRYLTPGYLKKEDNEEAFRLIPGPNGDFIRVFRTGDLGELIQDHETGETYLIYRGRFSEHSHYKINGVKINPLYIEQYILRYNELYSIHLQTSVVIKELNYKLRPVAYIVCDASIDKQHFMEYLKRELKSAEMPFIIELESLPRLGTSEKIDKVSLKKRQDSLYENFFLIGAKQEELSPIEQRIMDIFLSYIIEGDKQEPDPDICVSKESDLSFFIDSSEFIEFISILAQKLEINLLHSEILKLPKLNIQSLGKYCSRHLSTEQTLVDSKSISQAILHVLHEVEDSSDNIFFFPPLPGEGHYTLRHLVKHLSTFSHANIYGLSDPGIYDVNLIPQTMEEAVERYAQAILAIQPLSENKPYELAGFSFGSVLAFEGAKKIQQLGGTIKEVHLMDGYPPHFYQSMSLENHAHLLQTLVNFLVPTLNNSFFKESLEPVELEDSYSQLAKEEQIKAIFQRLVDQCQNNYSKTTLLLAKQHLLFIQCHRHPEVHEHFPARLYLTRQEQPYAVINHMNQVALTSNYEFYFWNHYIENLTMGGRIDCEHLEALKEKPQRASSNPALFWSRPRKQLDFGPGSFYRLNDCIGWMNVKNLSIYCIPIMKLKSYEEKLAYFDIQTYVSLHDKKVTQYALNTLQTNTTHMAQANLFCTIPGDKVCEIEDWLASESIRPIPPSTVDFYNRGVAHKRWGTITLTIMWLGEPILTSFSFSYCHIPDYIMIGIAQRLGRIQVINLNSNLFFMYFVNIDQESNIQDALGSAREFLGDFISILQEYIGYASEHSNHSWVDNPVLMRA